MRKAHTGFEDGRGPGAKECCWPLESEKHKTASSPQSLQEEGSPADTFIRAQWDQSGASDFQNYEEISVRCFKSLTLWEFATAAVGNKYRQFHVREEIISIISIMNMYSHKGELRTLADDQM